MEVQKTIRVAALPSKNIDFYPDANGRIRFRGFIGLFMNIVLDTLGINYEVVQPMDGEYGRPLPGGNYTGLLGMVQKEEADMAFALLRMSSQRYEVIDFSRSYSMDGLNFISKKPGNITPIFGFMYPFEASVWVGILISLCVLSTVFKAFDTSSSWGHNFLKIISSVLKQPLEMGDGSLKWRFLVGFWSFFTLVISSCYSSALLAFLTVPLHGVAIENFRQLSQAVQKGTHQCYILKGSIHTQDMETSTDESASIHEFIKRNNWYYQGSDIGSDKFINSSSVAVSSRVISKLYFGFRQDKYVIAKDIIALTPIGIALSKNFCCKTKLNSILARLESSGIPDKIVQDTALKLSLGNLGGTEEETIKPLTLKDLSGCLIILILGWSLSLVIFLGEIIVFFFLQKKQGET